MKVLVLFESFFGNTERVAETMGVALGAALGSPGDVAVRRISQGDADALEGVGLLIVGSATRAFRPSPDTTAFLAHLAPNSLRGTKVAAFDTRIAPEDTGSAILGRLTTWFGYAAPKIAKKLVEAGGEAVAEPMGFFVADSEGPLKEGELERAAAWVRQLA